MFALALALFPAAHASDRCGGLGRPCGAMNFVSDPPGASVTVTDHAGAQTCTAPCTVELGVGAPYVVRASLPGYGPAPGSGVSPIWRKRYDLLGYKWKMDPDPVVLRFAPQSNPPIK